MAVPWACTAVLELAQPRGDAPGELTVAVQGQVGWLEGVEQKPGSNMDRMECSDHGTSHLSSVIGCYFRMIVGAVCPVPLISAITWPTERLRTYSELRTL